MKKRNKTTPPPTSAKEKTAEFKLKAIMDTMLMTEDERGAYCREQGLYTYNLDEWKQLILAGLGKVTSSKEQKAENNQAKAEMKKLKSDLNRKDKALAEVSALLILKKKADLLWGAKEDD